MSNVKESRYLLYSLYDLFAQKVKSGSNQANNNILTKYDGNAEAEDLSKIPFLYF